MRIESARRCANCCPRSFLRPASAVEGILPPVARAPIFAIRKRAGGIIPLYRYIAEGILTEAEANHASPSGPRPQNILIAGGHIHRKNHPCECPPQEIAATGIA